MLALLIAFLLEPGTGFAAPPDHDNFGAARPIGDVSFSDSGSNVEATVETGEPTTCGYGLGNTVWYSFTPEADMTVSANTVGSGFDTILVAYTGTDFSDLREIYCNDDWYGLQSRVTFNAIAGTPYYFQLGGASGAIGDYVFNLMEPGYVNGTVTMSPAHASATVCVIAWTSPGFLYGGGIGIYISAGGSTAYSLKVDPGTYRIQFSYCDGDRFVEEWYNDKSDFYAADDVFVSTGTTTASIDATLEAYAFGGIQGNISVPASETVQTICVDAHRDSDGSWAGGTSTWIPAGGSTAYEISGLDDGAYKVFFYDCGYDEVLSEWYNDKANFEVADPVFVTSDGPTTGIDAVLAIGVSPIPVTYDLGISDLWVENTAVVTDWASIPSGVERRIHVSITNLSQFSPDYAYLSVQVCPKTTTNLFGCTQVLEESIDVGPGQTQDRVVEWNGAGSLGDMKIIAKVCGFPDTDLTNNRREVDHYVVVDNTDVGVDLRSGNDPCSDL